MSYDAQDLNREYQEGYDAGYEEGYDAGIEKMSSPQLSILIDAFFTIPHAIDPTEGFNLRWDAPLSAWVVTQGGREVLVRDEL